MSAAAKPAPIELKIWEPVAGKKGYVYAVAGRPLPDIARDFTAAVEAAGLPEPEYWSCQYEPGTARRLTTWPKDADPVVRLEVGGNEGYSLYLCAVEWKPVDPERPHWQQRAVYTDHLRWKLLTTKDDAKAIHALAFDLLAS